MPDNGPKEMSSDSGPAVQFERSIGNLMHHQYAFRMEADIPCFYSTRLCAGGTFSGLLKIADVQDRIFLHMGFPAEAPIRRQDDKTQIHDPAAYVPPPPALQFGIPET